MPTRPKPPKKPRPAPGRPTRGKTKGRGVSRPSKPGRSTPRRSPISRPGNPGASATFPWLPVGIGVGGILLVVALIFGGRALFAPKLTPVPTLFPTATSPVTSAPTATLPPEDVATATALPSATPEAVVAVPPDIPVLQRLMHQLVNEDRRANGLQEVAWDETAALAGTQHAKEMAQYGYISHRNLDGYGPDYRYAMAGGLHYAMENVHTTSHSPGGGPTSAEVWEQWVHEAQISLMESEGHRANILMPEHTHVGIGMAYDAKTGYFAIAQEFVNQYVNLQPLPHSATFDQTINLVGWLGPKASNPILNLAYEPQPTPLSLDALKPETYTSPAETYDIPQVQIADDGQLTASFTLNYNGQPGLYHIQLWVDTEWGQVQTVNIVVQVQ